MKQNGEVDIIGLALLLFGLVLLLGWMGILGFSQAGNAGDLILAMLFIGVSFFMLAGRKSKKEDEHGEEGRGEKLKVESHKKIDTKDLEEPHGEKKHIEDTHEEKIEHP
ncbi:MAG TPA: hypothetical protein HA254_05895 [Candidatus Diapherotrites archaeon]|uniref:Uncharacterized protein n=1 Tax=Candidatus Iainarchaeum sp. TaxID=3101447 RepID=A0A7J4IXN0_9ARCH|nr:hypothetical protein [Candidatus Diapherotrites archaeon]